jgi:hypothetical protein
MATKEAIGAALAAIGIPLTTKKSGLLSSNQRRLKTAAPLYLTDKQAKALQAVGKTGWRGRSIVTDVKSRRCAISIANNDEIAWVTAEGLIEREELVVKHSGMLEPRHH